MTRGLAAAILGGASVILGFATAVPHVIVMLVALIFVQSPALLNIAVFAGAVLISLLAQTLSVQQILILTF